MTAWNKIENLFESLTSSLLLYNCEVWSLGYLDLIEKIQSQFFKRILGMLNCTPGYTIRLETGRRQLSVKIFESIVKWIIKIQSMPRDRLPRISLLSLAKSAKRVKYNWVHYSTIKYKTHIDELFFKPIGESDLLNELDRVWTSEEIKKVSEKYASLKLEEDFNRHKNSTSLLIYSNLYVNERVQPYLNLVTKFENKSVIAQLRMLNRYNIRIKTKNKTFKLEPKNECNYCNIDEVNIVHYIIDCIRFKSARNLLIKNCNLISFNYGDFSKLLNKPSEKNIKFLLEFVLYILEQGIKEDFVKMVEL